MFSKNLDAIGIHQIMPVIDDKTIRYQTSHKKNKFFIALHIQHSVKIKDKRFTDFSTFWSRTNKTKSIIILI